MKYLTIFVLCFTLQLSFVLSEEITKEKALAIAHECKEETNTTEEDVAALVKYEPVESSESKCFRACIMKKLSIMDDQGKFHKENANHLTKLLYKDEEKQAILEEIIESCGDLEVPDDHCEAAFSYSSCLKKHAIEKDLSVPEI